jgi:signal recognition particle receptor subunit alpha
VRALFTQLYKDQIIAPRTSKVDCPFDPYFELQIQELEKSDSTAAPRVQVTSPDDLASPPVSVQADPKANESAFSDNG